MLLYNSDFVSVIVTLGQWYFSSKNHFSLYIVNLEYFSSSFSFSKQMAIILVLVFVLVIKIALLSADVERVSSSPSDIASLCTCDYCSVYVCIFAFCWLFCVPVDPQLGYWLQRADERLGDPPPR